MGAHSDVTDHSLFLLLLHVSQEFPFHDPVKFRLLVHKVDHAQIDVVRAQAGQQVLKGRLHFVHVPGADVLTVLPGGAEMTLNDPSVPSSRNGLSNVRAHIGL